jgi:hypothetical protein
MLRTVAVLMVPLIAFAQESGKPLKENDAVPSNFRAFVVSDQRYEKDSPRNRIHKMHDLVTDNGLNPVLAAFSRQQPQADNATAKLAKAMSALATTYKPDRLGAFVMFLTLDKEYPEEDDRDKKVKAVDDLPTQLASGNVPFAMSPRKSAATAAWGLDEKDEIVVMYYNRMVVQKVWKFTAEKPPTDEDIKAIGAYVDSQLKAKR